MVGLMPELLWHDGLLLRPHHLQGLQRHCQSLLSHALRTRTFSYGVRRLQVRAAAIPDFILDVPVCDVVMPDGTPVVVGENAVLAPLEFRHLAQDSATLDVWLGVAFLQEGVANVDLAPVSSLAGSQRYVARSLTLRDENSGNNARDVDTRVLQGRLFVGNRPPAGFMTLKIAELRKALVEGQPGQRYELAPDFVPASLSVDAAPLLQRVVRDLCDKLEAKHAELLDRVRGRDDMLTGESRERPDHLLRLHATNGVLTILRHLVAQSGLHPIDVHLHLTRLVGDLAVFAPDWQPPRLVIYQHDDPAKAFLDLREKWFRLLEVAIATNVLALRFVADEAMTGALVLALPAAAIHPQVELFLGVETDRDPVEVERMFTEGRTVLATPPDVAGIRRQRVDGLVCTRTGANHAALRGRTGVVVLRVQRDDDLWPRAVAARSLALLGDAAQDARTQAVWLFVTDVPDAETKRGTP